MRPLIISFVSIIFVVMAMSFMPKGAGLQVSSPAFKANGMIPSLYSCEGKDINPPFSVKGIPSNAKTLALIMHDPDAPMPGGFTHWVMWNVLVNGEIPENFKGAEQGKNGAKENGYKGMCPPSGSHHYHFMVYALDTELKLDKDTDMGKLETAMKGHIVAQGELVGLYKKLKP